MRCFNSSSRRRQIHAFSLVELSIVLVILGLLVGGVLTGQIVGQDVALVWPTTYMNRSGEAVREVLSRFEAAPTRPADRCFFS